MSKKTAEQTLREERTMSIVTTKEKLQYLQLVDDLEENKASIRVTWEELASGFSVVAENMPDEYLVNNRVSEGPRAKAEHLFLVTKRLLDLYEKKVCLEMLYASLENNRLSSKEDW